MTVVIESERGYGALRALIRREVETLAARLRIPRVTARMAFIDENGSKGGVDIRCALTLEVPRRQTLHVEQVADAPPRAFEAAFAVLERRLGRELGHARDQRRRPKKYFVAKRLLESDVGSPVNV